MKINEIREKLEKAEDTEEADLLEKERVIMERRAARMKVNTLTSRLIFLVSINELCLICFKGRGSQATD